MKEHLEDGVSTGASIAVTVTGWEWPAEGNTTVGLTTQYDSDLLQLLEDENNRLARTQMPLFGLFGLFMIVGIIGNSLVIHVYWRSVRNSSKKTFIMALALLDLSVCAFVIPFELYDLRNQLLFDSEVICRAMRLLEYATVVAAGFVLVSVSFERYYFLCKAFQHFTPTKSKIVSGICVFIAVLVASPSLVFAGLKSRSGTVGNITIHGSECSMDSETFQNGLLKRIYYYFLSFIFVICILLLTIIYIVIGRILMKYKKGEMLGNTSLIPSVGRPRCSRDESSGECSMVKHQSGRGASQGSSNSRGSIVVFFSVTVVFVFSFLPHIVLRILQFLNANMLESNSLLYNLVVRSYLISNVSNPFIYSILNASFRKQLKKTFMKMSSCFSKNRRPTVV